MSDDRPFRTYDTQFRHADLLFSVTFETIGNTPCNAKNVGWVQLSRYLRERPELPQDEWVIARHDQRFPACVS